MRGTGPSLLSSVSPCLTQPTHISSTNLVQQDNVGECYLSGRLAHLSTLPRGICQLAAYVAGVDHGDHRIQAYPCLQLGIRP